MANTDQEDEIQRLVAQLEEKDRQLRDQANSLSDMEVSLKEIQELMPSEGGPGDDSGDVVSLRHALKDKNDKIQSLVAEFDGHRADFRSTIDTLELASAETERVYETKVGDLLAEIHELRELGGHSREDVENFSEQLKSLEDLVAELEEGLEDARRGEAEARGEVEFLRGEVERGRSELRREREKAAKALQGAKEAEGMRTSSTRDRDVQMKDDEIRGLKAVIHSLSSGPEIASPMARSNSPAVTRSADVEELKRTRAAVQQLERERSELQGLVERKGFREEELERAIEQLRKAAQAERSSIVKGTVPPESHRRGSTKMNRQEDGELYCEVCETEGHDILTCTNMEHDNDHETHLPDKTGEAEHDIAENLNDLRISSQNGTEDHEDPDAEVGLEKTSSERSNGGEEAAPTSIENDADKWCALCEQDGHLAFDCPNEQY